MYLPPAGAAPELEGEVRALEKSLGALRAAIAQAVRGRDDTEADLGHLRRRLATKIAEALPDDAAIRGRLDSAIDSAFATARTTLAAHWQEITDTLTDACTKVDGELTAKRRAHARAEEESREQRRQRERLTAG
ncbi:hypothetical protein [Jiangella mangrovi]|uniref:Chromosome segregation ATPase n=1 Tax=Jiangella mangrovi TaxID=1524084 RepID=A0A7W9GP19_9ACTN|nr:hypothetical protein [Jiangella mangrovi]MBB5787178.1 chromosome segregation ATPase [Jiangella mangrovi]